MSGKSGSIDGLVDESEIVIQRDRKGVKFGVKEEEREVEAKEQLEVENIEIGEEVKSKIDSLVKKFEMGDREKDKREEEKCIESEKSDYLYIDSPPDLEPEKNKKENTHNIFIKYTDIKCLNLKPSSVSTKKNYFKFVSMS